MQTNGEQLEEQTTEYIAGVFTGTKGVRRCPLLQYEVN